jgi:hypothetical protein
MTENCTSSVNDDEPRRQRAIPARSLWAFAVTTLLGAFLLFQIQPLISKVILPRFGGASAVWTSCMLFFQIVLFAGYAYSHLVATRSSPRGQAIGQCLLLLAAVAVLPITPDAAWQPTASPAPVGRILLLLTATVGLPYFVLATTSPMIQAWFTRGFPGRSPYRLYALSNIGSLLALLSYPFVFEPAFDLVTQSRLWSAAFVIYAVLSAVCLMIVWRLHCVSSNGTVPLSSAVKVSQSSGPDLRAMTATSLRWSQRLNWLFLPACGSLVLLATTNHVCQDVAPVPFLWVLPLSLYLLTFILCFDRPQWYGRPFWAFLAVLGIVAITASSKSLDWTTDPGHQGLSFTGVQELALHFGTMLAICMVCHGELVRLRPEPRHLTEFYLMLSAGGALGGAITAVAAPLLFKTFLEWNIGMLVSYGVATVVLFVSVAKSGPRRLAGLLAFGFAMGGFVPVLLWQGGPRGTEASAPRLLDRQRNFYGVVSVWEYDRDDPQRHRIQLRNAATIHGQQFAAAGQRSRPSGYYTPDSGVGRAILELQKRQSHLRVGIVGLGAGCLAGYARPGDRYTFYEINPAVAQMAKKRFTFLSDAEQRGATIDVLLGDARLQLELQEPQRYDLLVLDAFSGDAIPVHLLTREAMDDYRRHVSAEDVIVVHATNTHLHLVPVVRALAEDARLGWRRVHMDDDADEFRFRSDWVAISGQPAFLAAIPNNRPPLTQHDDFAVPVWTDQVSSLFRVLVGPR